MRMHRQYRAKDSNSMYVYGCGSEAGEWEYKSHQLPCYSHNKIKIQFLKSKLFILSLSKILAI